MPKTIYLDNNATTPVDPRVLTEMLPYFSEKFGNPASRSHVYGWESEEAVDIAKENIATLIGAHPHEIVFTSGATEAINLAIKGLLETQNRKNHIITTQTEHKAVLDVCAKLESQAIEITYLPVNSGGTIDIKELEKAIKPNTGLICILYANNETGVIQPIAQIGSIAKQNKIPFFTDATQAVGKIPVQVTTDGIDMLCMSAHKLYGPKGVGVLFIRKNQSDFNITAQIEGGGHQLGLRSGTLNVPGIVGLGEACKIAGVELEIEQNRLSTLRNQFERALVEMDGITINGNNSPRLPHCTNITIEGIDGEKFILNLGSKIAFSQSSACTSATIQPSHVLLAMGLQKDAIQNSFRFSFGRFNTEKEVEQAILLLKQTITQHRNQ